MARDCIRQIDPNLVGEKRYKETDFQVVKLGKWAFYALSHNLTSTKKIEACTRRLEVLERNYSSELDRTKAVRLFRRT